MVNVCLTIAGRYRMLSLRIEKEESMQTIRWGMIGCGAVAEQKSGPAFQKILGSSLVAVMSRNGDHAADYAKRHGVSRWYDDATRLIQDPEVDAIYIAT